MAYRQHVLCRAAIPSALSTASKYHRARSTVHFNTNVSRTLLELIANYDTLLLASDVRTNCAASNDARVHDDHIRIILARQLRYFAITLISLLFKRDWPDLI